LFQITLLSVHYSGRQTALACISNARTPDLPPFQHQQLLWVNLENIITHKKTFMVRKPSSFYHNFLMGRPAAFITIHCSEAQQLLSRFMIEKPSRLYHNQWFGTPAAFIRNHDDQGPRPRKFSFVLLGSHNREWWPKMYCLLVLARLAVCTVFIPYAKTPQIKHDDDHVNNGQNDLPCGGTVHVELKMWS
jgi:hypothetical protein